MRKLGYLGCLLTGEIRGLVALSVALGGVLTDIARRWAEGLA
jgi:hypothetical protein